MNIAARFPTLDLGVPEEAGEVPPHALVISVLALAVAGSASFFWPESLAELTSLVWILALVPPFMLAFHRGWRGAAVGLIGAMGLLIALQVIPPLWAARSVNWQVVGGITVVLIGASLGAGILTESFRNQRRGILALAYGDPLTGLSNRRVLDIFLASQFAAAQRGLALAAVMVDVDGFKVYNDARGHQAGDRALRAVGEVLRSEARSMDLCGRYGGDEFVAVLPGATGEEALAFAARLCRAVKAGTERGVGKLSISAGVSAYEPTMAVPEDLLLAADAALYEAKAAGGNQAAARSSTAQPES